MDKGEIRTTLQKILTDLEVGHDFYEETPSSFVLKNSHGAAVCLEEVGLFFDLENFYNWGKGIENSFIPYSDIKTLRGDLIKKRFVLTIELSSGKKIKIYF